VIRHNGAAPVSRFSTVREIPVDGHSRRVSQGPFEELAASNKSDPCCRIGHNRYKTGVEWNGVLK
jgi:hypothetical protein